MNVMILRSDKMLGQFEMEIAAKEIATSLKRYGLAILPEHMTYSIEDIDIPEVIGEVDEKGDIRIW